MEVVQSEFDLLALGCKCGFKPKIISLEYHFFEI